MLSLVEALKVPVAYACGPGCDAGVLGRCKAVDSGRCPAFLSTEHLWRDHHGDGLCTGVGEMPIIFSKLCQTLRRQKDMQPSSERSLSCLSQEGTSHCFSKRMSVKDLGHVLLHLSWEGCSTDTSHIPPLLKQEMAHGAQSLLMGLAGFLAAW